MQNQSNYELKYSECLLPKDFPMNVAFYDPLTPPAEPVRSLHFHNCMEIGYCYSGAGLFFVNNKVIPFSKGDVSIIFKNEMHRAQSTSYDLSQWTFISLQPEELLKDLNLQSLLLISKLIVPCYEFSNIIKNIEHPEICQSVLLLINEL